MRMWNVNPKIMCNQHLLGEHLELHMFVGTMIKGNSVKGFVDNGLLEVRNIFTRHDEIVDEMENRGMSHSSPMNEGFDARYLDYDGDVDIQRSLEELAQRCDNCKKLQRVSSE